MTTVRTQPIPLPRKAQALSRPLWLRTQQRLRDRHGFDLDSADALSRIQSLLAATPEDADLHLLLGAAYSTRGADHEAESEVRRALEIDPRHARGRTTLAAILVRRGELEAGLREARNAAALDLDDPNVLYNLGLVEWHAGERRTASAAFDRAAQALRGDPAAPRPWWRRWFHRG